MNKLFAILVILILIAAGAYFYLAQNPPEQPQMSADDARAFVEGFGRQLQKVSLLAQPQQLEREMQSVYGPFVAPELIALWLQNPQAAPGRLTSSPWPDRIEVKSVEQIGEGAVYYIEGEIVEVTNDPSREPAASNGTGGGGIGESPTEASRRPISLGVELRADGLRITEVVLGANPGDGEWIYSEPNAQGIQFQYVRVLPTRYISTAADGWPASTRDDSSTRGWPPRVSLEGGAYSCSERQEKLIGDREYCVVETSEGAAGSIFRTFAYITAQGDFVARAEFTLQFPRCANYGEDEQALCEAEQAAFDVDGFADRIVSSIRML